MQSIQHTSDAPVSPLPRTSLVVMGRQDYPSVLLRLMGMNLYRMCRRKMSRVILIVAFLLILLVYGTIGLVTLAYTLTPPVSGAFGPPLCSKAPRGAHCVQQAPPRAVLERAKQQTIKQFSSPLRLPMSLSLLGEDIVPLVLSILVIIVVATHVGGDYTHGTIRLQLTRGPTRLQYLFAMLLTMLLAVTIGIAFTLLSGILLGYLLNLISGVTPDFSFWTASWSGHALLYMLVLILTWFVYAVIALFFSLLGRSSSGGIVGGLLWLFIEPTLSTILKALSLGLTGNARHILRAIPDYLIGDNLSALSLQQGHFLFGSDIPATLSSAHALLVLGAYLLVFGGVSCWLISKRDITN